MLTRLFLLALLTLLTLLPLSPAQAADMFGRPEAPVAETPAAEPEPQNALPEALRPILGGLVAMQTRLNQELRQELKAVRDGETWRPAGAIILLSFLYGVFHAVGPGHGKLVVGGYFLSRRARISHGLAMSAASALVQASVAVALVALLVASLDMGAHQLMQQAALLETLSYAAIAALGLWMAWGSLTGRAGCDHDHEHEHHHGCGCGHEHHHAAKPVPLSAIRRKQPGLSQALLTGASVGLRPCSGAILVLLFTLANGIFWVGVLSTYAMGVGVAITVAAVSLASLGLHRGLGHWLGQDHPLASRLRQALAIAGGLIIALFGAVQLFLVLSGTLQPMTG